MSNEKFVTIEYETWERVYKNMELEIESLKLQLNHAREKIEREEEKRHVCIYISLKDVLIHQKPNHKNVYFAAKGDIIKTWLYFNESEFKSRVELALGYPLFNKDSQKQVIEGINEQVKKVPRLLRWLFKIRPIIIKN